MSELQSTTSYSAATQGHITNSLDWRFLNWHLLLGVWREHPLFGTGQSSTREFVQPLGTLPHNEYVRVLVEGGVVGALVVAFGLLLPDPRRLAASVLTLAGSVGRALVIAVLVDGVADNLFNYTPAIYLVAVGIGLALGARRHRSPRGGPGMKPDRLIVHQFDPGRTSQAESTPASRTSSATRPTATRSPSPACPTGPRTAWRVDRPHAPGPRDPVHAAGAPRARAAGPARAALRAGRGRSRPLPAAHAPRTHAGPPGRPRRRDPVAAPAARDDPVRPHGHGEGARDRHRLALAPRAAGSTGSSSRRR